MSKHTPGPWEIVWHEQRPTQALIMAENKDTLIAFVNWPGMRPLSVLHANARLIAAAPELLNSLKEVLAAWTYEANQGDGIDEEHDSIYEKAKKLIAKTEGDKQ